VLKKELLVNFAIQSSNHLEELAETGVKKKSQHKLEDYGAISRL
jgi:hypothetical protein